MHGNLYKVARRAGRPLLPLARRPPFFAPTCHYYAGGVTYFLVPSIHSHEKSPLLARARINSLSHQRPFFKLSQATAYGSASWNAKQTVAARLNSEFLTPKRFETVNLLSI